MISAVVTGATSKLGVSLVNELLSHNVVVYAFVHKGSRNISRLPVSDSVKIVECNLDEMKNFIPSTDQKADVFYHFAWGSTDKTIRDNPIPQLENLNHDIDAVNLAHRFGCRKFIGAGSQAEYGVVRDLITEETRCEPITSYGIAKYAAGKLSMKLCNQLGMTCVWPRIFSVYGPGEHENTLLAYAVSCAKNREKAKFSAAVNDWNYLYVDDFAKYMYALGDKDSASGVYNIASEDTRPLKDFISELATVIEKETGNKLDYELSSEPLGNSVPWLNCSVEKLLSAIAIEPKVPFSEGISKILK